MTDDIMEAHCYGVDTVEYSLNKTCCRATDEELTLSNHCNVLFCVWLKKIVYAKD